MTAPLQPPSLPPGGLGRAIPPSASASARIVGAGLAAWLLIAAGFLGLRVLMQERPQFAGQPLRTSKMHLVQDSPAVVMRRAGEDASVVQVFQPTRSEVGIQLRGRRDHRGLRTIVDMGGDLRANYWLSNRFDEAIHILFKCPHPTTTGGDREGGYASEMKMTSSIEGWLENHGETWLWSGMLEPGETAAIELSYTLSALRELTYRITNPAGSLVNRHCVSLHCDDLPTLAIESADGGIPLADGHLVWERSDFPAPDFVSARIGEGRHLYRSLLQLVEIGPLISLLFLVAALGAITVRRPLTVLQVLTLAAGYALYFPMILYLSSRFTFAIALTVALAVPGLLVLNFVRWILGSRAGVTGGLLFLGLYQVFPTLAALAGWNRGMVLLCLGTVTLAVLIHLQNRAFKLQSAPALLLGLLIIVPSTGRAQSIQLVLPTDQVGALLTTARSPSPLIGFDVVAYHLEHLSNHLAVTAEVDFRVVRPGDQPVRLFASAPHLTSRNLSGPQPDVAEWITLDGTPGLFPRNAGAGRLEFTYRVPIEHAEGKLHAEVPLVLGGSGTVTLESSRADLQVVSGALWMQSGAGDSFHYEIGVAGPETLRLEWFERDSESAPTPGSEFYGIGITRSQHLTIVHSDGSCAHFAEYDLPSTQANALAVRIANGARVVSASVNGVETDLPRLTDGRCEIPLPDRSPTGTGHRVSLRLACPPIRLGFLGSLDLTLPEVFMTVGTLQWVIALPSGFDLQITASGLEPATATEDLPQFGEYSQLLRSQPHVNLIKALVPPNPVIVHLKYRQRVPGFYDSIRP